LPSQTRLLPDWEFLQRLRDAGRERVAQWFDDSGSELGKRSSFDPLAVFGESV
jgi:hypothetical protein